MCHMINSYVSLVVTVICCLFFWYLPKTIFEKTILNIRNFVHIMYSDYKELLLEKRGKALVIKFNNPSRKNSLNRQAYKEITRVLRDSNADDSVTIVAFTGVGDFYTSGNDLSQLPDVGDFDAYLLETQQILLDLVRAFLNATKILFAVVNGPCLGIGVTTAALCDVIYCSETAYFQTPFTKLGLCPEGCSSFLFPKLLGKSKATEMLVLNEKLTAKEALQYRFISKIFINSELDTIWQKIMEYSELPPGSLSASVNLLRRTDKEGLESALVEECRELKKRWYTDEFLNAIFTFANRKRKSSKL